MSERFIGPLFKRLTATDAGVGLAKISGPTMLREIRDFLPRPAGRPRRALVRARLFDDGPDGRRQLGEILATLQAQGGGGGKSVEVYLSDLGGLRTLCDEGDLLLIEPSADEPDLVRITRIAGQSPRFGATDARTGGRDAGLLSGGILPRTWETLRLRPVDDAGRILLADFSVEGVWPRFDITFESKDGHGRNSDYEAGFELLLTRLGGLNAILLEARITSERMLAAGPDGAGASFDPAGQTLPLAIGQREPAALRRALVLAGSRVGVPATGNGNTTRRMTLAVELAGPPLSLHDLEERLAGVPVATAMDARPETPTPTLSPPLTLLPDLDQIDGAFSHWREALLGGSRALGSGLRWIDAQDIGFRFSASKHRPEAADTRLGVRQSGPPWTVELNPPRVAADANGLSSVATDQNGGRFLLRQGRLQKNPDSAGEISGARFAELSGLSPVEVTGDTTPLPREWFVVADLDAPAPLIRASTARFVQACAAARARSLGLAVPPAAPPLEAAGEVGGSYTLPAAPARPERLVQRIHGEVWQALSAALEPRGAKLVKLRHDRGYEVDGIVWTKAGPLLVEIKTQASAADVYEGVGQLILYAEMMQLGPCRRLLLLPFPPSAPLISALRTCDITVETFTASEEKGSWTIVFSETLLQLCGGSEAP